MPVPHIPSPGPPADAAMGAAASAPMGAPAADEAAGVAAVQRAAGAAIRSLATQAAATPGRASPPTIGGKGAGAAAACPRAHGRGGRSGQQAGDLWRGEATRTRRRRRCWAWALART